MPKKVLREVWVGLRITIVISIVCGIAYPLVMTGISQVAFNNQANGSLITDSKGNVIGSKLIGQCYYETQTDSSGNVTFKTVKDKAGNDLYFVVNPSYFQSRPRWLFSSSTNSKGVTTESLVAPCDPTNSSGSNLGPSNPILIHSIKAYTAYLYSLGVAVNADGSKAPMPVDLVTGDFTGFDPDISEAGALAQVNMVAKARHLDPAEVQSLVEAHVDGRDLGIFGAPNVNVLELNIALDGGGAN